MSDIVEHIVRIAMKNKQKDFHVHSTLLHCLHAHKANCVESTTFNTDTEKSEQKKSGVSKLRALI